MHRCLAIQEVQAAIVGTFDSKVDHPTLKALAVTNKSLGELSLDAMWSSIPFAFVVLRMLPEGSYEEEQDSHGNHKFRLMRIVKNLAPNDFDRVRFYSKRVRIIGTDSGRQVESLSVAEGIGALSAALLNTTLFPNLREATFYTSDLAPYTLCPTMMVPSLKKLTWKSIDKQYPTSAQLLIALLAEASHASRLESLTFQHLISIDPEDDDFIAWAEIERFLYPSLPCFSSLAYLTLTFTSATLPILLFHLCHLPKLATLLLEEVSEELSDETAPSMADVTSIHISSLRELQLVSFNATATLAILTAIKAPELIKLCAATIEFEPSNIIPFLLSNPIPSQYPCLEWLKLHVYEPPAIVPDSASYQFLESLVGLRRLRHLSLNAAFDHFWPTPGVLANLAPSWPLLDALELRSEREHRTSESGDPDDRGYPLIQELVTLTHYCPSLKDVTVAFCAMSLSEDDIDALLTSSPPTVHLTPICLRFLGPPPEDADLVARWLTTLFKDIRIDCSLEETADWEPINNMCQKIQQKRMLESEN